jgi:hypothetical protein
MKTGDIFLLSNCTSTLMPVRRIFLGHDKAIAVIASILAVALIATGIVATAVAGFRQDKVAINRTAEGVVAIEKQVRRGGPMMGYKELW